VNEEVERTTVISERGASCCDAVFTFIPEGVSTGPQIEVIAWMLSWDGDGVACGGISQTPQTMMKQSATRIIV